MFSRQFSVALYDGSGGSSRIVNSKLSLFNCLFAFKIVVKVFIHCKQHNLIFLLSCESSIQYNFYLIIKKYLYWL